MTPDRLSKLQSLLEKSPGDPFLWYAIGLEHKNRADFPAALEHLTRALQHDPAYIAAYFQLGQTHAAAGDIESARSAYNQGIAAARRKGDHHAAGEMEAALEML